MSVKSINALMKYLRDNKNIEINGSAQKKHLRNIGYYHGYKGYRFYSQSNNLLNYSNFNELMSVYQFDMNIKAIIYPKIMFLETALKNHVLESIINKTNSDRFADAYSKAMTYHKTFPVNSDDYKKALQKRLNLRNRIYSDLSRDYGNKSIVQHYYRNDKPVPIWAIFELISFGEFGQLVSCLDVNVKKNISTNIGFYTSHDRDGKLPELIVMTLKDLRNAVAHNDPVFDVRFKTGFINYRIQNYITFDTGIVNVDFKSIVEYIILISYLMKLLKVNKNENKKFLRDFMDLCESLRNDIPISVYNKIIPTNTRNKIQDMISII